MRYLYSVLIQLVRPFALAWMMWRGLRNPQCRVGFRERLGLGARLSGARSLWVHAVSLGEVTASAPLIRALRVRHPTVPIILTTATFTGRSRAKALFGESLTIRFMPYDTSGSMRRFIARAQPRLAVILETELWPNLFHQCRRSKIPVLIANARLSRRSVMRYRRFGGLFRAVFQGDIQVAAQSAIDAERFIAIGAQPKRTRVIGNIKFDVALDLMAVERGVLLRATQWSARPVWIAGSTHAGEEEMVLDAHAELASAVADVLLLLVPRHPERFESVAELLRRRGILFQRRSAQELLRAETRVLLVDTIGELGSLYAAVDVAFVGGSLVPVGGHNLLEPAALGIPVITGPYHANGAEIARLLLRDGAVLEVAAVPELTEVLARLLNDPEQRGRIGALGLRAVEANRGSVARLLELIEPIL